MTVFNPQNPWSEEHPEFQHTHWRYAVLNGDTLRGYVEWVNAMLLSEAHAAGDQRAAPALDAVDSVIPIKGVIS